MEDVERLALRRHRLSGQRGHLVDRGPEQIPDVQVHVGVDALRRERRQKVAQPLDADLVKGRVWTVDENPVRVRRAARGIDRRIHMVETDEVDAEPPQPFRDPRGIGLGRKIGAEREIHAEEADPRIVGGVRGEIGSDREEVAVADEHAVRRPERVIERTEIGRAVEIVLIERERVQGRGLRPQRRDETNCQHGQPNRCMQPYLNSVLYHGAARARLNAWPGRTPHRSRRIRRRHKPSSTKLTVVVATIVVLVLLAIVSWYTR